MKATFIGGGNMATALIGALLARDNAPADFRVVEPSAEARSRLGARHPAIASHRECAADVVAGAEVIVFAVKPQNMREAARAVAAHLAPDHGAVVLSIAAGIRLGDLRRWLGGYGRIVRAMPNTPALIGKGISALFAESDVDAPGRALATAVVEAAGEVIWVEREAMLDAVTGVSGSGPAYVFYFIEALEQAARELGFDAYEARRLAYATFAGATALAEASSEDAAVLRAQVTSKGGTTERAIATLEASAVGASIVAAVKAAARRAEELGDALGKDS
jgi:pyrroline-5-carboxylate reductase